MPYQVFTMLYISLSRKPPFTVCPGPRWVPISEEKGNLANGAIRDYNNYTTV